MPIPETPRSTYRERRIQVMLQDRGEEGRNGQRGESPSDQTAARGSWKWKRLTPLVAVGTAILCAAGVFFLLFRTEAVQTAKSIPVQPVKQQAAAVRSEAAPEAARNGAAAEKAAAATPTEASSPAGMATAPLEERVEFRLRKANRPQTFGPLSLRLMSTNARKGLCSVAVSNGKSRSSVRTLQTNRPIQIQSERGAPVKVTVSAISRDLVSGSITTP